MKFEARLVRQLDTRALNVIDDDKQQSVIINDQITNEVRLVTR